MLILPTCDLLSAYTCMFIRNFIEKHYVDLKKENPEFPFLIRECSGITPKMYARYDRGIEKSVELKSFSSEQVMSALEALVREEESTS